MTPDDWSLFTDTAANLTLTAALLGVIVALVVGKLRTGKDYDDSMARMEKDTERGWNEADKARAELSANNATMDRFNDALKELTRSINDLAARNNARR